MFLRVTGRLCVVIIERSEEERRAIAQEVRKARGAQPITAASRETGISPPTWRRIEAGQTVREDILERASIYVGERTNRAPQSVAEATDEQLLAELGRRLAARRTTGEEDHGSPMTQDEPQVEADVTGKRTRVRVTPAKSQARRTDG